MYSERDDFMWLVGILEGEGCFTLMKVKNNTYPRIQLVSTDRDIIARAFSIFGCGSVSQRNPAKSHYKIVHHITVSGVQAKEWMERLLPHMGERRQVRIQECLDVDRDSKLGVMDRWKSKYKGYVGT